MNSKRSYDNTKRAEGAVATRERILQAGLDLAWEQIAIETTLEHVYALGHCRIYGSS